MDYVIFESSLMIFAYSNNFDKEKALIGGTFSGHCNIFCEVPMTALVGSRKCCVCRLLFYFGVYNPPISSGSGCLQVVKLVRAALMQRTGSGTDNLGLGYIFLYVSYYFLLSFCPFSGQCLGSIYPNRKLNYIFRIQIPG